MPKFLNFFQALYKYVFKRLLRILYPDQLRSGFSLFPGEFLKASNGICALYFSTNGNVTLVRGGIYEAWSTQTTGQPGAELMMQNDGNLVLLDAGGAPLWDSRTAGNPGARVVMQDDGNLVVYSAANNPVFATSTELKLILFDRRVGGVGIVGESFTPQTDAVINYTFAPPPPRPGDPVQIPGATPELRVRVGADGAFSTEIGFEPGATNIHIVASDSTGLAVGRKAR